MNGKLIVVDGLDGSGKHTNCEYLFDHVMGRGFKCRLISFPDYGSRSSALVKMYLDGEFGTDPLDVSPYVASSFYAVDRAASYLKSWKKDYDEGSVILADRYTTSNIIHQACKLPKEQMKDFILWTYEFEYEKLMLPKPDAVLYLDMPIEVSQKLIEGRYAESGSKDIHESNVEYLKKCRESALYAAELLGWTVIEMSKNGKPLSREENFAKIKRKADEIL